MFNSDEQNIYNMMSYIIKTNNVELLNLSMEFLIMNSNNLQFIFNESYKFTHSHIVVIDKLLQEQKNRVDPSAGNNEAIRRASGYGRVDVVDRLLQDVRVDPSADSNYAIRYASCNGHIAVVDRLLQDRRVDPSADDNFAIHLASRNGHVAVVERLLQDPRIIAIPYIIQLLQSLFKVAIGKGHMAIVKRLIQDPRIVLVEGEFTIMPLLIACKNARVEMVDYLLKQLLKPEYENKFTKKKIDYIINKINNNIIHNIIPKEINSTYTPQNFPNIVTLLQEFNTQVFGKRRRTQKKR